MDFSTKDLTTRECYRLLSGMIVPRPVAWITTLGEHGQVNLAPFSAFTIVCPSPPMVGFSSGPKKDTTANILREQEFVVNFARVADLDPLHGSSCEYPSHVSEVEKLGLSVVPSRQVATPRIRESSMQMECRLHAHYRHGEFGTYFIVGEIVAFQVADEIWRNSRVDSLALDPLCVLGGGHYARIGEVFHRQPIHGLRNPWGNAYSEDPDPL